MTTDKISGYRTLTADEIAAVNSVKQVVGDACGDALEETWCLIQELSMEGEIDAADKAEAMRWSAIARTHFQEGLQALVRAITRPRGF